MDLLLATYRDLLLSVNTGNNKGKSAVSKPIFLLSVFNAIDNGHLNKNEILLNSFFLREEFGKMYESENENKKGYKSSFFIRPLFHLSSSPFYHLIWKQGIEPPSMSHTPSAKYLRENLLYAKLDDELWDLLQEAENREYLKRCIIERYLTKQE